MKHYALAITLLTALGLSACSDPDDQRGDPTDPTQRAEQQDQRGQSDPATERDSQPAPANSELRPESDMQQSTQIEEVSEEQLAEHAELRTYLTAYTRRNEADEQNQCAFFALGEKACGGPESYVVYSQKGMGDENIAELEKRAQRYRELDALVKAAEGAISTCDITPEPQVTLENGRCVARSAPN